MALSPKVQGTQAQIDRAYSGLVGRSKMISTPTSAKSKGYSTYSEEQSLLKLLFRFNRNIYLLASANVAERHHKYKKLRSEVAWQIPDSERRFGGPQTSSEPDFHRKGIRLLLVLWVTNLLVNEQRLLMNSRLNFQLMGKATERSRSIRPRCTIRREDGIRLWAPNVIWLNLRDPGLFTAGDTELRWRAPSYQKSKFTTTWKRIWP